MRNALAVLALLASTALASNSGPENLKGVSLCFDPASVYIVGTSITDATYKAKLQTSIANRLNAYRVPTANCTLVFQRLYVQVDTVTAPNGIALYSIQMDVYDYLLTPGLASIYNAGAFGSAGSAYALPQNVTDQALQLVDKFAADYAKANP